MKDRKTERQKDTKSILKMKDRKTERQKDRKIQKAS